MNRLRAIFFTVGLLLLAGFSAEAQSTIITATITVTNITGTTNGQTITVNGDTRTWTNSVVVPATQILTNNTIYGCATNLFIAVADAPFLNLASAQLTNGITLTTIQPNGPMTVALSAGWGLVVLSTNTLTSAQVVRVPATVEYSTNQTNIATYLVQYLESSTYSLSDTAPAASNYVSATQPQTVTGKKTIISPLLTNNLDLNGFYSSPTLTNGVNRGNAFSSPGTNFGVSPEQFGKGANASGTVGAQAFGAFSLASANGANAYGFNAQATNANDSAFGYKAVAGGGSSTALGNTAYSSGNNSLAVGSGATASQTNATAIGQGSSASAPNSTAIGQGAQSAYTNSTALGQGAATTDTNQNVIGTSSQYVVLPGNVSLGGTVSNLTTAAQGNFPSGSDIAFGRYNLSTLANGNNAGVVVGTNVYCYLSGPTGAFTVNGIAGGRNGKFLILVNRTGQNMTIANDSGVDPTAANRIYCLTGADKVITGNSAAMLIYDSTLSHWIVLNFTQ